MLISETVLVLLVLSLSIIFLITELIPPAATAISAVLILEMTGVLTTAEAFSGFSNSTVILFGAMFVVGQSVFKSGLASFLGQVILQLVGQNLNRLLFSVTGLAAFMSALLSNTGTTATLMPLVSGISDVSRISRRRMMMPLAFATSLGGLLTVVGTPPNIIVNGILGEYGLEPFGFLEFGKVGIFICLLGLCYMVFAPKGFVLKGFTGVGEGKKEVMPEGRGRDMWISGIILFFVVVIMISGLLPLHLAAVMGALLTVITGCLSLEDAIKGIDFKTIFLFAGMLPLSIAMEKSGAAQLLADTVVKTTGESSPMVLLMVIYLLTMGLSQFMSNTASAALMAPIGIAIALEVGISPYPVLMTVALSGSAAFLTPVATPPNAMVMGVGEYRVLDYLFFGLPLAGSSFVLTILLIPLFFPF